jgi:hypothetical protein
MTTHGLKAERRRHLWSRSSNRRRRPTPRHAKTAALCQCPRPVVSTPPSPPIPDALPARTADAWRAENRQCWHGVPGMSDPPARSRVPANAPSEKTMPQDEYTTDDDPLDTAAPSSGQTASTHVKLSRAFVRLLKQNEALHEEIVGLRVDLNNERKSHAQQREHTLAAQSSFADASGRLMSAATASDAATAAAADLQEVWGKLTQATEILKMREKTVQELENEVKRKESRLEEKEKQLYQEIHKTREDVRSVVASDDALSDDSFVELSAFSGSTDGENSLVHKYYDLMGDVKIFRERLYNFESEHNYQLAIREERRQLGGLLEPPDEDFYEAYFSGRKNLIQDLSTANADMQQLRTQCELEGVHVDSPSLPPLDDADALDHSHRVPRRAIHFALPPSASHGRLNAGITLVFGDIDNRAFVGHWLHEVRLAQRAESSDVSVPDTKQHKKNNDLSQWTEREAEDFLPFPDYGLLSTTFLPGIALDGDRQAIFLPEPPLRRYSEPTIQLRKFNVHYRSNPKLQTAKSVS